MSTSTFALLLVVAIVAIAVVTEVAQRRADSTASLDAHADDAIDLTGGTR